MTKEERKEYYQQWYLKNKEKIKERYKGRISAYCLANKEKIKERQRQYRLKNRDVIKEKSKVRYLANKEEIKEHSKQYYISNREKMIARVKANPNRLENKKRYFKKNPWAKTLRHTQKRCNSINDKNYPRYGGRGIKSLLKVKDVKFLWFRDKAYLLKQPSIDRIDNDGHYVLSNCRYIEMIENSRKQDKKI